MKRKRLFNLILQTIAIVLMCFSAFFLFFSHLNIKQHLIIKQIKETEQQIKKLHYENIHLKVTLEKEFSKDINVEETTLNRYQKLYPKDIPKVIFE